MKEEGSAGARSMPGSRRYKLWNCFREGRPVTKEVYDMKKVGICTDSGSGITQAQAKEMGIGFISIPFMFGEDGTLFYEDVNLTKEEFWERLPQGPVHTSQPIPVEVLKVWDAMLKEYDEIVYIPMSSGLSGSCQSAVMLSTDYDGRVQVVNNQRISVTQQRTVEDALEMAEKGWTAKEIHDELERTKGDQSIYIMVDTLTYLKRGGRITPAAAALGTMLRLKPVLKIFGERLDAYAKARNVNQARTMMINALKSDIQTMYDGDESSIWLYAVDSKTAEFGDWIDQVKTAFPDVAGFGTAHLPLVINCHIGEGALAIACSKKMTIEDRRSRTDC